MPVKAAFDVRRRHRDLTVRARGVVAGVLGCAVLGCAVLGCAVLGAGQGAEAAVLPPTAALVHASVTVSASGGPVVLEAAVGRASACVLSSTPAVAGWARSFPCRKALVTRTAVVPPDLGRARRLVLWITVAGPGGRIERGETVHQLAAPVPHVVPLEVTTAALPAAIAGEPYSMQLAASGGTAPYSWSLAAGSLPAGLALTPGGLVSGTPAAGGASTVEVVVRDRAAAVPQSASAVLSLTVLSPSVPVVETRNWSGYEVSGGALTAASGTFDVPNLVASSGSPVVSEWVGIDGSGNSSLIQAGVQEEIQPGSSTVDVHAWWEILPASETSIAMAVQPGDQMSVSIFAQGGGQWQISVVDETSGQSFATVQSYNGPGTSAEWIVEAPMSGTSGAVATLGDYVPSVTFGEPRFIGAETGVVEDVLVQGGAVVSTPSPLGTNGFSVAYGAAAPPAP
ncbi:MAG: G1 family glutamic endopeptidase [Acidimicrobiales bacterium]